MLENNVDEKYYLDEEQCKSIQVQLNNKYDASNPAGYISGITSSDVTTALGYTPYNSTNPNGYISGITSSDVTTALGFTPYNSTNPDGFISGITSSDVTTALGYTPYNATNPSGYISSAAVSTLTDVSLSNLANGEFLKYNSTSGKWENANIPNELPSQSGQSGKYLTTNGSSVSWASISVPTKISDLTDDTSTYPIDQADTLTGLTATITELNYVDGVTSAIQTQLNGKQDSTTAVTHTSSTAAGSVTQPVYIASDGTATATTYSLAKSVPADAVFTDTTYSAFTGATGSAAGTSGLVPAPTATDNTKFLKGDGTWGTVDALPSQTSQSGKFLTTNGTTASWATVTIPTPTYDSTNERITW